MKAFILFMALTLLSSDHALAQYVQYQVAASVYISETSSDPNAYTWSPVTNTRQKVYVAVEPANSEEIYIQRNNVDMIFNAIDTDAFIIRLEWRWDGGAYQVVYSGDPTNYVPPLTPPIAGTSGLHTLEFRWMPISADKMYYRRHYVHVVPTAAHVYQDNIGNTLTEWETNPSSSKDPVLISEGFDAYNRNYAEYLRDASKKVTDEVLNAGHRVYILNYRYNSQDMRNSAAIYNSALRYVSSLNSNRTVYAIGISMGGVIVRYALAKAEGAGTPLPATEFISIDAPQQGAVLSQALQNFLFYDTCSYPDFVKHGTNNTAARQLLYYNAFGSLKNAFYTELQGLNGGQGYPTLIRTVGVAFSSGAPNPHSGTWLNVRYGGLYGTGICNFDQDITLSADERLSGSYLPRDITDRVPERHYFAWLTQTRYSDPTFIPYVSALDLTGNISRFDEAIDSGSNHFHDELPDDVVDGILQEFGLRYSLAASISGPSSLDPGDTGYWSAAVSRGTTPYSYHWYYERSCSIDPFAASTASSSTSGMDAGDATIQDLPCDVWFDGGTNSTFSLTKSSSITYRLKLTVIDSSSPVQSRTAYRYVTWTADGSLALTGTESTTAMKTAAALAEVLPEHYALHGNAPNPFSRSTEIRFDLPESAHVRLAVYNMLGQEVRELVNADLPAGFQHVTLSTDGLSSGVYLYRITTGEYTETKRMVVAK